MLCDFDHRNFVLAPLSFLHNVSKTRSGRNQFRNGDLNYKNPRPDNQLDINEYGNVRVGELVINEESI